MHSIANGGKNTGANYKPNRFERLPGRPPIFKSNREGPTANGIISHSHEYGSRLLLIDASQNKWDSGTDMRCFDLEDSDT